jgi:hypothetical protein
MKAIVVAAVLVSEKGAEGLILPATGSAATAVRETHPCFKRRSRGGTPRAGDGPSGSVSRR